MSVSSHDHIVNRHVNRITKERKIIASVSQPDVGNNWELLCSTYSEATLLFQFVSFWWSIAEMVKSREQKLIWLFFLQWFVRPSFRNNIYVLQTNDITFGSIEFYALKLNLFNSKSKQVKFLLLRKCRRHEMMEITINHLS